MQQIRYPIGIQTFKKIREGNYLYIDIPRLMDRINGDLESIERQYEIYTLGFPNQEVTKSFWESLATQFFRGMDGNPAFNLRK